MPGIIPVCAALNLLDDMLLVVEFKLDAPQGRCKLVQRSEGDVVVYRHVTTSKGFYLRPACSLGPEKVETKDRQRTNFRTYFIMYIYRGKQNNYLPEYHCNISSQIKRTCRPI